MIVCIAYRVSAFADSSSVDALVKRLNCNMDMTLQNTKISSRTKIKSNQIFWHESFIMHTCLKFLLILNTKASGKPKMKIATKTLKTTRSKESSSKIADWLHFNKRRPGASEKQTFC